MKTRSLHLGLLLAALTLLALACTASSEGIPPCTPVDGYTIDPCEPGTGTIESAMGGGGFGDEPHGIRAFLGGELGGEWASHIVLRGTYLPKSVRCVGKDSYRKPEYDGGGRRVDLIVHCFADVRVNDYILGSGPSTLTVVAGTENTDVQQPSKARIESLQAAMERALAEGGRAGSFHVPAGGIGGREQVMFLVVLYDYDIEAWYAFDTFDLIRMSDGTVKVVHPHRDYWLREDVSGDPDTYRSRVEWTLAEFATAVAAANTTRLADYGGRSGSDPESPMLVTNAANLRDLHVETGNVNHPDGPPTLPPPIPQR